MVLGQSGRAAKVDGPKIREWTVQKAKTGRSFRHKLDDPKGQKLDGHLESKWTVPKTETIDDSERSQRVQSGRSFRMKLEGPKIF